MKTLIKFTDENYQTQNNTTWVINKTNSIPLNKRKPNLCTSGVYHAYSSLNLALLVHPIHNIRPSKILEVKGTPVASDALKVGAYELTPVKEISPPQWYTNRSQRLKVQRIFAILCAEDVLPIYESTPNHSKAPRETIELSKKYIIDDSAHTAYSSAAADAAARAASAAARAAYFAIAASAAARAAADATDADPSLDLIELADRAVALCEEEAI